MNIIEEFDKEKKWFDIPESVEEQAKKDFTENYERLHWKSLEARKKHINEMSSNHIANCLSYLTRVPIKEYRQYWSTIFRLELVKRDKDQKELKELYDELSSDFKCLEKWYDQDQEKINYLEEQISKLKNQVKLQALRSLTQMR